MAHRRAGFPWSARWALVPSTDAHRQEPAQDRKSTRLNSSHRCNSYAVFCLKKKNVQALKVELNPKVASMLVGPGAARLLEIETQTKKRFFVETKDGVHLDHLAVLAEGSVAQLQPSASVEPDAEVELKLVEVDMYGPGAGVGKLDALDVVVADAAKLVGKKVKARIVRVLDGTAYAVQVVAAARDTTAPITAEAEAEKPTRKPPVRKQAGAAPTTAAPGEEPGVAEVEGRETVEEVEEPEAAEEAEPEAVSPNGEEAAAAPRKKTRRGSRGGKNRRKRVVREAGASPNGEEQAQAEAEPGDDTSAEQPSVREGESPEPAEYVPM